ncbi:MAG: biopolymer transporter ExbD [Verrucomicrobiales bacterium]|nr:biopolymer transporter ExbD [Verrucomicrobiales bacterium]
MSPMIDLSFLLLVYFLVTSTLEPVESDLAMTMPSSNSDGGAQVEIDQMTVQVNSAGNIVLNDEILDTDPTTREVPLLLDRLRTYAESAKLTDSKPMVIIAADDAAKGQRFIDVLNALADQTVNIRNVTISGFKEE